MSSDIEHEIQRLMLERLGIEWPPGEPFVAVVEAEITRLREAINAYLDDDSDENWDRLAAVVPEEEEKE